MIERGLAIIVMYPREVGLMLWSSGKRRIVIHVCEYLLIYLASNTIERFWRRFWHIQDVQQSRGHDCRELLYRRRASLVDIVSRSCIHLFDSIAVYY
jgi:hypothetical protein